MTDFFCGLSRAAADRLTPEDLPHRVSPMLARLEHEPFSDPGWIYERKLDGERTLAIGSPKRIRLQSRNGKSLNDTYPEVADALQKAAGRSAFVVDGEVVAFEGTTTSFSRLQSRMQIQDREQARASGVSVYYYVFDLLHAAGRRTTGLELRQRKQLLKRLFTYRDPIRYTIHRNACGEAFLDVACERGWEGIMAKRADSPYVEGRSSHWRKFKCVSGQEFVIGGYTDPEGERKGVGALLLGYYSGERFCYAGKVGTGFTDDMLHALARKLRPLGRKSSPFTSSHLPQAGVHWVTPRLVAEVAFTEWTNGRRLRHPRFKGLRDDKDPEKVVRETPAKAGGGD